jgi:tripartite-type tricarboxylate transporter receptor subunit TctC
LATAAEQGLAGFDVSARYGLFAAAGTPAAIVDKLHEAAVAAVTAPALQAQMREIGADMVAPPRRSRDYLRQLVESEIARWRGPIVAAGARAE